MALGDWLGSGGSGNFGDSGGGFDWGGTVSSIFDGSTSDGIDYGSLVSDYSDSSSSGGWMKALGGLFGGGSSGGQGGGNIWESVLAGAGTAAGAMLDEKTAKEMGKQQRQTLDFTASLKDFYEQKNKVRKRAALDTYGQFSTMDRWAPGAVAAPPIDSPARPGI